MNNKIKALCIHLSALALFATGCSTPPKVYIGAGIGAAAGAALGHNAGGGTDESNRGRTDRSRNRKFDCILGWAEIRSRNFEGSEQISRRSFPSAFQTKASVCLGARQDRRQSIYQGSLHLHHRRSGDLESIESKIAKFKKRNQPQDTFDSLSDRTCELWTTEFLMATHRKF